MQVWAMYVWYASLAMATNPFSFFYIFSILFGEKRFFVSSEE